ncbi:hypothetical protein GCM10010329_33340 [Streptomyces spiroverticillatus]|uniref:Uncharacterized protein n=1 Tax=Streptomyces finlayi TaxID=67296 RepID=A0A918WWN0_9ACTN|nr:hypothetical protein [Streptomyces finlayi]GHA07931.1 hypothetical protein GCM10010329_33340 [Streptomyces spiroverticillatus]GHC91067.1 hypothetical protein GCM10010334_25750 [Streptomyces finlayi]
MDFTEIAIAVITTGPAYIAVGWAILKDKHQQAAPCAQHAGCGPQADAGEQGEGRMGCSRVASTAWALAA